MRIRAGYRLGFETFGPTPVNFLLSVRPERQRDLITPENICFDPFIPASQDADAFGNAVTRIVGNSTSLGRDATDCALSTSFGTALLGEFNVHTDEVLGNFANNQRAVAA